MTLEEKIKDLPDKAGIYQYFDENDKLLYIGKAKNLKKCAEIILEKHKGKIPESLEELKKLPGVGIK